MPRLLLLHGSRAGRSLMSCRGSSGCGRRTAWQQHRTGGEYRALRHRPVPAASLATQPPSSSSSSKSPPEKDAASQGPPRVATEADAEDQTSELPDSSLSTLLRSLDPLTRKQLGVLAVGTGVVSLGFGMVVPVLPQFAAQWGDMGATGVGVVVAAPALAKLALNRAAGRRADTHGRVHMMVGGAATSAVGNFLTAVANSIGGVCGARLVVGSGSSMGGAASQAYLADVTSKFPKHRGAIMGTLGSIGMVTYGLGPAAGGLLAEQFGPSISFGFVGVAAAICAAAYSRLPETLPAATVAAARNRDKGIAAEGGEGGAGPEGAAEAEEKQLGFYELLASNPRLQAVVVMDTAIYIGWAVWLAVVPLQAAAVWGATPGTLGAMYSVMAIAGAIGAPLGGVLSDRVGRDSTIAAGAAMCAASTLLLPFSTTMIGFGSVLVVWDFAEGIVGAALSALAADAAGEKQRAQVFALRSQIESGVFLVAPIGVGLLADTFSLSTSLWTSSATMSVAVGSFMLLSRRARSAPPPP
jgi:DHA1 family multidrug resistance protein-like MFS transporter